MQSHTEISDTTKLHDWTVPESKFVTRPSLLKVVGINDPNNLGEVRISFGAFLAAGSGELGSLTRTSPDRPRVSLKNIFILGLAVALFDLYPNGSRK